MWFADVICDFDWFTSCQGDLGTPRIKVQTRLDEPALDIDFLLYGGEFSVRHLRILFHTDKKTVVDECLNCHIQLWIHALEASSAIGSEKPCSVALFPRTTNFAVITGEGDESAKAHTMSLNDAPPQTANYEAIGTGLVNWTLEAKTHLFFLVRFLNPSIPPDTRWLNGYRLVEWHLMQGKDGLAGNTAWRALLEKHRAKLQPHLRSNQTLYGLFEETRALAAHAILDNRSDAERLKKPGELITWTFSTLEAIISEIMNEPKLGRGLIKVVPRVLIPPA